MSAELHIIDGWEGVLAEAGLDTLDALMQSSRGECVSWHTRGQTYRIDLPALMTSKGPDGEVIFLKRDTYTNLKDILTDLCRLCRPQPPCINEVHALRLVAELGIPAPEVIAWGQRRRASLPWQAAMLMRELPGVPLHEFLRTDPPGGERRRGAMRAAGAVAARLYEAGLSWPDIAPKHFILNEGAAGILDLARMRHARLPRRCYVPKQVRRFCAKLRDRGGDDGDIAAFLDALQEDRLKPLFPSGGVPR